MARAWIQDFLADVEAGHSGKTMALVAAARASGSGGGAAWADAGLPLRELCLALDGEPSAAQRNRLMRRWLSQHRDRVLDSWAALGFPAPPAVGVRSHGGPTVPPAPQAEPACGGRAGATPPAPQAEPACGGRAGATAAMGIVVFDFDQTLSTRHVGLFEDLGSVVGRSFGGPARLEMLRAMMQEITACGHTIAVVTRNSRDFVRKVLRRIGFSQYVEDRLIYGFEDFEDDCPKSRAILDKVLPAILGTSSAAAGSRLLFVDDEASNIRDVQDNCPGASVLQPPRQGGMGQAECDRAMAWARQGDGR